MNGEEIVLMLGNEAIARGALEAGVRVAAGYPGTPSSEIIEVLAEWAKEHGIYVEWSTNEKVAVEVALAASFCNLRSLAAMKHVGVNVASDTLFTATYTGVRGGFVIISADDPSCHSSQNEQDNRLYGPHMYIPILEPHSPQEAKDITMYSFELSEKFKIPVMVRTTTRLSHSRGNVRLGPIPNIAKEGTFERSPEEMSCLPSNARKMRVKLIEKIKSIEEYFNDSPFNCINGDSKVGIIASGLAYAYTMEALRALKAEEKVSVLKLSTLYPLPKKLLASFLEGKEKVLVVEELEPFIESYVKAICCELGIDSRVEGKNLIPLAGELTPLIVLEGIASFLGEKLVSKSGFKLEVEVPPRPPVLCAGCPHRSTFYAIKSAVRKMKVDAIYPSDIGCYGLGFYQPLEAIDISLCMGASIGIACGLSKFSGKIVIATIGDSTFMHAGIPALINATFNPSNFILVILDNGLVAMTGHQPSPVTGVNAMGEKVKVVLPEDLVKACSISFCKIVDPYYLEATISTIMEAIEHVQKGLGPAVVISRRKCALTLLREARDGKIKIAKNRVDEEKCVGCLACIKLIGCPALLPFNGKVIIDESICTGCGLCGHVCPFKAVMRVET
ncbi:MAG: indolepyruvate ferredoxin oxidoreductase subunit alpha [Candidatus Bathyarchaeia archaeon]|nr:indolepyruvate ferredoxin oxidoreductase subunit alpha [Candidatus Bathyarchaeota archaeon]